MNVENMTNQELEDQLTFLSKEIQRIIYDSRIALPLLEESMRQVAKEIGKRKPV